MADFVAGDTNRTLRITATFPASLDVTGASASLIWKIETRNSKPGAPTTSAMTNLTPASGTTTTLVADYLFTSGQLKAGTLIAEMRVTTTGGLTITSDDLLKYEVRPRI